MPNFIKARILIIVENLPVPFDTRVWQEALALTEAGYLVTIICPKGKGFMQSDEILDGIRILRHDSPSEGQGFWGYLNEYARSLSWELWLTLKVYFQYGGFDVIQACNPPDLIFIIGAIFKLLGKKFVFDHHDINPELYIAKFGKQDYLYRILLFLEHLSFRTADLVISTNASYRKIALERGQKAPEQVVIVRSGPRLERMQIRSPKQKLKKHFRYLVGYVGVIGKQEGLDYLLNAAYYIKHNICRRDIGFVIIGTGPYLPLLQDRCQQMELSDCITFTGRIPDDELLDWLNTADVCINADEYNDMNDKSTMNKVMEYMALAKPIVQFDLTEGRYSAGDASLYAEPNDPVDLANKIVALMDNPRNRQIMGQAGRKRIENELHWDYNARILVEAYDKLTKYIHSRNGGIPAYATQHP